MSEKEGIQMKSVETGGYRIKLRDLIGLVEVVPRATAIRKTLLSNLADPVDVACSISPRAGRVYAGFLKWVASQIDARFWMQVDETEDYFDPNWRLLLLKWVSRNHPGELLLFMRIKWD